MKPYLRELKTPLSLSDYPDNTSFEAGFLVTKNAGWRSFRPIVDNDLCMNCLLCYLYCPDGVIFKENGKVAVDYDFCKGCGICRKICKVQAIKMEAEKG